MSYVKITDILKKRGSGNITVKPAALSGPRIKVLVGTCKHCLKLKDNVIEAAKNLGIDESEVEIIADLERIIRLGVITTPSLIVDGRLVSTGKVLPVEQIEKLLGNIK